MEEEEALRNHCRRMISLLQNKQQHPQSSGEERRRHKHKGAGEGERTEPRRAVTGDELRAHGECNLPLPDGTQAERGQETSHSLVCQGPEVQLVPPQLLSMLRLKTFEAKMRRAAETELHDPAVCSACEQERASVALKSFIRRKKTQLQFQTLKGRLNTHTLSYGVSDFYTD